MQVPVGDSAAWEYSAASPPYLQAADGGQVAAAARAKRGHQGKRSASHDLFISTAAEASQTDRQLTTTTARGSTIQRLSPQTKVSRQKVSWAEQCRLDAISGFGFSRIVSARANSKMLASATCASPPGDRVIRRSRLVAFSKTALLHTERRTYSAHLLRFVWAPSCTAPDKLVTRSWP
ncbi:hypothetical protein J3E68DRAFT_14085 [Trichoderma sp. SZMC 28012]